jgi:hypothetical protein
MCQNGDKVSEKLTKGSIERPLHPPYSPDIRPCDFWLFGTLKHQMKNREFQSQQAIRSAPAQLWNDFTVTDVQRVFQEWMEHLTWVVGNNGEYSPN